MEIAEVLIDINVYEGLKMRKGREYVLAGAVMHQISKIHPGGITKTKSFDDYFNLIDIKRIKEGDEVFLFRSGGIGDVMFMLPLARYLKEEFGVKIKIGTSPMYLSVVEGNEHVDKLVQMPFLLEELEKSDYHIMFEGVIEDSNKKAHMNHAVDLFFAEAGIDPKKIDRDKKIPEIFFREKEIEWVNGKMENLRGIDLSLPKIGIQVESSSPIRTFPLDKMIATIRKLIEKKYSVFIFGSKSQTLTSKQIEKHLGGESLCVNLIEHRLSLRESCLYAAQMNVILAPDSAFIHITGGIGVPVVGLYGCFPSLLRMRYYKNAIGIDCGVACSPSFLHGHAPCEKGSPSPCFSVISIPNILDAIDHLLRKTSIEMIYPTFNVFKKGELVESPFIDATPLINQVSEREESGKS